jgi:hypothetical protein
MIEVKATQVQAIDEDSELLFTLSVFDTNCAVIEMKCLVDSKNIDQLTAAVRRALALLDLES